MLAGARLWLTRSLSSRARRHSFGFDVLRHVGDRGARVVDAVGGQGLAYNGGTSFAVSLFGYPSNLDGGHVRWACWGTTQDNSTFDNKSKIACTFGPGPSGGPWLWQYSDASGQAHARSVMSTVNSAGVNKDPYFDTAVRDASTAGGTNDSTAVSAPSGSASVAHPALHVGDDLVGGYGVPVSSWRAVGEKTLELSITAGPGQHER